MDNVDGSQVSSASPLPSTTTTPSPTLILLCIVSSAALVSLALLIQSDSPFIRTIQHAGTRLWDRIGSELWQTSSTASSTASNSNKQQQQQQHQASAHTRSPSQSSSKKGKTIKGGKRKVVIARDADMSNVANASQSRRRAGNSGTGATPTPSQQSNPSASPVKPSVSKTIRQTSATPSSSRPTPSPKKPSLLPTPATSPATEQPEPTTPTRPAAARTLSNTIFHTILNPRAAAYEFRAQYSNLPHDPSTTTDATSTTTHQPPEHADPSSTALPDPAFAISSSPSDGTTPYETSGAVSPTPVGALQPYDAFLVLDVEATCEAGSRFDHPNEIIEWPVILMRWEDKDETTGTGSKLVIVDEFTSFVRPTWRPQLSEFCTSLTGITQADIDPAPTFPEMLALFEQWLQKHNLIPPPTALLTPPQSRCPSPTPFEPQHDNENTVPPHSDPEPSSSASPLEPADADGLTPPDLSGSASPPPATAPDLSTFSPALSTSSLSSPAPSFAFSARASQRTSQSSFAGWNAQQFLGSVGEGFLGMDAENDWDNYAPPGTMSRFAWCTDGPFDLRDFLVKQCFISKIAVPDYFLGDVIDIRRVVTSWVDNASRPAASASRPSRLPHQRHGKRPSLNIPQQLQALSLGHFTGQQHRGIDDAKNICRIMESLASRNVSLEANMFVNPNRRWYWMGRDGVVFPPIQS